jgi:hypothetical protein
MAERKKWLFDLTENVPKSTAKERSAKLRQRNSEPPQQDDGDHSSEIAIDEVNNMQIITIY